MKNKRTLLWQSFAWALAGLYQATATQRNLRIHLVATGWVAWLGAQLELDGVQWTILLLTCGIVIITELLNSAVEALTNHLIPYRNDDAKAAKDIAAGAVLAGSIIALCAGIALLWQPDKLLALWQALISRPLHLTLMALAVTLCLKFIFGIKHNKEKPC